MRGIPGLREAAALVMEANPEMDRSDTMETIESKAITEAYLAGFLSGRGGFGTDGEKWWVYFHTLDHSLARTAMDLWGGYITEQRTKQGVAPKYKFTANGHEARGILETLTPYLMGEKREHADEVLAMEGR